ncbi:Putative HMP/thiamine import ATP-binding protein YkoD [Slackia heliotrinireducens]|uniref:ATPase component of various ABC-type transport systems with duplicated ATPase domain n=1 Tax=Slackia heliotrinireducens (strain ATCC 29202 / DSM 20476 / NCTC 11029 / RHS 1) TaxID=471855 RepID=C7N2S2_SLAHD|nr:ABC transporter ATP-binding protein [Slackia heliotrinireducens]ACV23580.1 ATPase component of various ABC-type transport systems with duplicated ATPase domain [Slackia heliotrinireducens DSM 20476]VEH03028.1 Putative HMP/thiamine import ATP-binding protein YkoD [Slackia heliotrinireducens]
MIHLENISFGYKGTDATGAKLCTSGVRDVSLHVGPGEFVVVAGGSGCGKTTITRLINGLVPHYYEGELEGRAQVCGLDVRTTKISDLSAHVGSVFQNPRSQFFNVDTTSELAFASENRCIDPDQIRADIRRVVGEMNLEPLMDRSIFALSGGEKQKVACASVAVAEPEIVVLDEPSSNLDTAGIDDLRSVLALWKSKGKTIVVAEHRLYYLADLADRLVIMKEGRIVEELDASQLASMTSKDAYSRELRAFDAVDIPAGLLDRDAKRGNADTLVCRDFEFRYRNSDNGISIPHLEFGAGQITAIVGRNGTGKSTFAHLLCGLLRKGRGTVEFGGRVFKPKERTQLCYMILQDVNHQLFTSSVLEEVVLSAPADMPPDQAESRAREVLEQLDLAHLADVHPMALSGGQKQRVAIASGVMAENPVLMFDEPTSGLDLPHMRQVADLLRTLRDAGKVVIVITHDTELIREAADRVVELPVRN